MCILYQGNGISHIEGCQWFKNLAKRDQPDLSCLASPKGEIKSTFSWTSPFKSPTSSTLCSGEPTLGKLKQVKLLCSPNSCTSCHPTHAKLNQETELCITKYDRIPSTTPGAEPPRDAKDSGSARSHSTHLETSSSNRP